jgi:hypothetical protein
MIVHPEPAAGPSREDAAHMRRRLLNAGVESWLVSSTPDLGLPALMRHAIPHLVLVPDVERDELAEVLHPAFGEVDGDWGVIGGGAA